ncbi:MAG TPA: hypothetical protein VL652_34845 [Kutzneria sp.]|jgi:hypothetical protein|nr:hypothetical protein [Kutzneria sp.]
MTAVDIAELVMAGLSVAVLVAVAVAASVGGALRYLHRDPVDAHAGQAIAVLGLSPQQRRHHGEQALAEATSTVDAAYARYAHYYLTSESAS